MKPMDSSGEDDATSKSDPLFVTKFWAENWSGWIPGHMMRCLRRRTLSKLTKSGKARKIACLEETALAEGWSDCAQLVSSVARLGTSSYRAYLCGLL